MSTSSNSAGQSPAKYSEYYSRVKRVIIPLTNYHPFHTVSDIDSDNPNFIDRPGTAEKLKSWLDDTNENPSGAYLITGYRGMGKSSFVGKVANSLMNDVKKSELLFFWHNTKTPKKIQSIIYFIAYAVIAVIPWIWPHYCFSNLYEYWVVNRFVCILLPTLIICVCIVLLTNHISFSKNKPHIEWHKKSKSKTYLHYIKVNIGNEIRNERDILAILSTSIANKVKRYVKRKIALRPSYFFVFLFKILIFSLGILLISSTYDKIISPLFLQFKYSAEQGFLTTLLTATGNVFIQDGNGPWWVIFVKYLLSAIISYALCFRLLTPFILSLLHLFSSDLENPHLIIKRLDALIDRINCSIDENANRDIPASSVFSFNLGVHKSKRYQPASVREIEYELAEIINALQGSKLLRNRFIIILDELDKLDTSTMESNRKKEGNTPSFSYEEISSDSNMNPYNRQHHILMFLGRLKYFTTNAKAKFVFIAGHELYDAYLADVSDREYAVSSMFNGVLNLNSFLSSRTKNKDITRMAEAYLCKAIVNLDYLKSNNSTRKRKVRKLKKTVKSIRKKIKAARPNLLECLNEEVIICNNLSNTLKDIKSDIDLVNALNKELEQIRRPASVQELIKNTSKNLDKKHIDDLFKFSQRERESIEAMSNIIDEKQIENLAKLIQEEENSIKDITKIIDEKQIENLAKLIQEEMALIGDTSKSINEKQIEILSVSLELNNILPKTISKENVIIDILSNIINKKHYFILSRFLPEEDELIKNLSEAHLKEKTLIDDLSKTAIRNAQLTKSLINLLNDIERIETKIRMLEDNKALTDGGDDTVYMLQNVAEEFQTTYYDYTYTLTKEQWESTFHLLKQFVTYLTLTSNGAPKKLTNQMEKYVISKQQYEKLHDYTGKIGDYVFYFGDKEKGQGKKGKESIPNTEYFLAVGYYERELIGFIHYIAQPIFRSIINSNSDYGDKLLVTSLFLVSHLYKHHGSGFSWRNLEYIPELIESNKTPELRGYIKDILLIMEKMDLTSITSGIYNFKFSKSLIEEISHFSRKFEEVSAIFNFSLDYFRSVKKYYQNLLSFYDNKKKYNYSQEVVANIYSYIGDIQMAGEEYTEAAASFKMAADIFKEAIRKAQHNSNEDISLLIVRYTYSMLKLGLTYEKRNTFDSAYLVYNSLTNALINLRHIDDKLFGLQTGIVYNRQEGGHEVHKVIMYEKADYATDSKVKGKNNTASSKDTSEDIKLIPDYVNETDTGEWTKWIYGDEMFSNLYFYLTPKKEQILSKLTAYEDLRIAYLSILAKLFSLEKQNMSGITRENVELSVSEFEYMYSITKMSSKYILAADFYRKLGDILYYKNLNYYKSCSWDNTFLVIANGFNVGQLLMAYMFKCGYDKNIISDTKKWFTSDNTELSKLIKEYENDNDPYFWRVFIRHLRKHLGPKRYKVSTNELRKFRDCIPTNKFNTMCMKRCMVTDFNDQGGKGTSTNIQRPCVACRFYNKSLFTLYSHIKSNLRNETDQIGKDYRTSQSLFFLRITYDESIFGMFRENELKQIALALEAMGNTMLSCAEPSDIIDLYLMSQIIKQEKRYESEISKISNLDRAILYNITASRYYEKASEYTSMTECLHKVMQILNRYINIFTDKKGASLKWDDFDSLMDNIKNELSRMIRLIYESKSYHIIDINKFKQIIHSLEENKDNRHILLGLTSMMPEIQDLVYDYFNLQLLSEKNRKQNQSLYKTLTSLYNAPSLRCYNNTSLASNRVNDYIFKSTINYIAYNKAYGNSSHTDYNKPDMDFKKEIASFLKLEENKLNVFLIVDSIFCLTSAISILSTIRTNTLFSNISYTDIYLQLTQWVQLKEEIEKKNDTKEVKAKLNLREQIKLLIPETSAETIKKSYYLKLADYHYKQAIQMHTEGSAYQNMIDRFYILDDDLQNNTSQFLLALERYSLRTVNYKKKLKEASGEEGSGPKDGKVSNHSYYDIDNYIANYNDDPSPAC